jgi:superfamily II RNA helicase
MLKGTSEDLLSSFYLSYNMLLNSQRLEDVDV